MVHRNFLYSVSIVLIIIVYDSKEKRVGGEAVVRLVQLG